VVEKKAEKKDAAPKKDEKMQTDKEDKDKEKKVEPPKKKKADNPMRSLRIEKVCLNICVGESGDRLTRAGKVLDQLTGQTPVASKARYTVRSFAIRRNEKNCYARYCSGTKGSRNLGKRIESERIRVAGQKF